MKIRFLGQRNILGIGTWFNNYLDAAKKTYFIANKLEEVDIFNQISVSQASANSGDEDVNIWFINNPNMSIFKGKHIIYAIFESDKIHPDTLKTYQNSDLIWVLTKWARDVLIKHGIAPEKIDVIPGGVDIHSYHPFLRKSYDGSRPFRFLAIGKYEKRKAYEELLEAFGSSFRNSENVELIIKADFFLKQEEKKKSFIKLVESHQLANIKLYWGAWERPMLVALYQYADAFVFPTRAEGWGLPIIEAASTGLPIITTFYSGQTEFLEKIKSSVLPVDFELVEIEDPEFVSYWGTSESGYGNWAQPKIPSISSQMEYLLANFPDLEKAAMQNSYLIRKEFNWDNAWALSLQALICRNLLKLDYSVQGRS